VKIKPCLVGEVLLVVTASLLTACTPINSLSQSETVIALPTAGALSKTVLGFAKTTSFDVYLDHNRLHLLAVGTLPEEDKVIMVRYTHSDDGGQHWSKPANVVASKPPSMASRGNDIQLAVTGEKLVALWQTTGELPGWGAMVSVYSHDGGKTWQAGTNPAVNDAGDQSHIDITADNKGNFHAVWLDDRDENGYQGLRYARSEDAGIHWQANVTLDDSSCSCCWNKIATTPTGALNVLYRDMEFRDMALMQSIDNGVTWQKTSTVGDFHWKFDGCPHVGGGLAYTSIEGKTTIHSVVWTGLTQKQGLYYLRSTDNGKVWSTPHKLGQMAVHADIATTGGKSVRVVWDEMSVDGSSIFSAQSDDNGLSWTAAKQWSLSGHSATHPRIVPVHKGYLLLWTEKQPNQLMTQLVK
jgi:hypothetical protein